jgi:hypothetical protein
MQLEMRKEVGKEMRKDAAKMRKDAARDAERFVKMRKDA